MTYYDLLVVDYCKVYGRGPAVSYVDNLTFLKPMEEDGAADVAYSKAHIAKVCTLEATR